MRSAAIILCAVIILVSFSQVQATIIHVPGDSSTIQGGIDGAVNGDTVLVGPGTYYEHINFNGKAILVASHFILDGLESSIESTVIDGGGSGTVAWFVSGEDSSSVIRGFTITGGYAAFGGGILCYGSSPTITENFIVENQSSSSAGGAGIYCLGLSHARIYRNLVARCIGPAAIVAHESSHPKIINNTVCHNSWGGISTGANSDAYLKNNIFCDNGPYGIHFSEASFDLWYNDVFGQDENYVGLPDQTGINGNISADPLFQNPSAGDYHLTVGSPCMDAGDPADSVPPGGGDRIDMGAFECEVGPFYRMTVVPDTTRIVPGDSGSFKIIVTSFYGFDQPVNLSFSELPPEASGYLEPDQLIPTDSAFLSILTTPEVSMGFYPITLTAAGGEFVQQQEVVLVVAGPPYDGPVWHVANWGADVGGTGSAEYPFRTIQKGIDTAGNGDTVLVEQGTYVENINFLGKAILVASRFILDGEESTIQSTIIDGNHAGSAVTFRSGENRNSVIRGFTIRKGYHVLNGGIHCEDSSPTITENFIYGNSGYLPGKGIQCESASPLIYRNVVTGCSVVAAVRAWDGSQVELISNTIHHNVSGLEVRDNSSVQARNNILSNNGGYGILVGTDSWSISYNDVFGNDQNYVDIPDQTGINGNISSDPLFENPSANNYHLTVNSPCIDAGDPADSVPPGGGERIDMGAFEFVYEGVHVSYRSHQIDDFGGNNNGVLNPGEDAAIPVTVINVGSEPAYGVSGTLRGGDDFLFITDSVKSFGDVGSHQTATSIGDYQIEIDPFCPDSHQVTFELELTDGSLTWLGYFTEIVADTDFVLAGIPDAVGLGFGESTSVEIAVISLGGFASEVWLSHSDLPSGVNGSLEPDHLVPTDTSTFNLAAQPDAPAGSYPVLVTATGGGISREKELDCQVFLRGDANGDGMIDVGDPVYMLNYLFKGGDPPDPDQAGDANCDGVLNLGDVVRLLGYLFKNAPPPRCP